MTIKQLSWSVSSSSGHFSRPIPLPGRPAKEDRERQNGRGKVSERREERGKANWRCKRVKRSGDREREGKKAKERVERRQREGPYLNDIVAGVHTRRLPLIAPVKRPCYLAGGATEREDPRRGARVSACRTRSYGRASLAHRRARARARPRRTERVGEKPCVREEDGVAPGV